MVLRNIRFLLTTFSGYPITMSFFYPDTGLAVLARHLQRNSYDVTIRDFNNIDLLNECVDERLASDFSSIVNHHDNLTNGSISERSKELINIFYQRAEEYIFARLKESIINAEVSAVGIKLWLGKSCSVMMNVARRLKDDFPYLIIAAGGPAITCIGDEITKYIRHFDFITIGDGEKAIISIGRHLEGLIKKEHIENTYYWRCKKYVRSDTWNNRELTEQEIPVFDEQVYLGIKTDKIRIFMVEDSRGCTFVCPFCPHSKTGGNMRRDVEAQRFANITQVISNEFQSRTFRLTGSCPSPEFLMELSNILLSERRPLNMSSFFHPINMHKCDFSKLRSAGFRSLLIGIESVDDINSGTFLQIKIERGDIDKLGILLGDSGIFASLSFIIPLRFDSGEFRLFLEHYPFMKEHSSVILNFPTCFPGTAWWKDPVHFGLEIGNLQSYMQYRIFRFDAPDDDLLLIDGRGWKELWGEFYKIKKNIYERSILLNISDDSALIAQTIGMNPADYQYRQNYLIRSFNVKGLDNMMRYINQGIAKDYNNLCKR